MPQIYLNPITKEKATILRNSKQTGGAYTLIEVELQPGGGNPIHFHEQFTEHFYPQNGVLGVHHLGKEILLKPSENFKIPLFDEHRFYNPGNQPIIFRAKLEPGQPGFEKFMAVLFGLVGDGKTFSKNQTPYNPFYALLLFHWGDTHVDHFVFRLIRPILSILVVVLQKVGVEKHLLNKYYLK